VRIALLCFVAFVYCAAFAEQGTTVQESARSRVAPPAAAYTISFARPESHLLHVTIDLPDGDDTVHMPVWNALYQVRDFSQYVAGVTAADVRGKAVQVSAIDKTSWSAPGASHIEYDIFTDVPGPYSAEFSRAHAFLNLAQVLMYSDGSRKGHVTVTLKDIPPGWKIATVLERPSSVPNKFMAANYDALVDAPIEAAPFNELSFESDGVNYRIAIDAASGAYDPRWIEAAVRKIVRVETSWMVDDPCREYLFIYHFPETSGGGGMEHACSTAIDVPARRLAADPTSFLGVTAHEFFHMWNVKRIRPQSMEPVDYSKEQYTPALWFSEGVTSTVEDYMLLTAGMIDEPEYLRRLGAEITTLQNRPAHGWQSAEQSSLNAWLEKYAYYRRPERSVSYYNKGEILGVMMDLAIRDATGGARSLRDAIRWMNSSYAGSGRSFPDSDGVRDAVEAVAGTSFRQFFQDYVAGVQEIQYDHYLGTVGLRLVETHEEVANAGFITSRDFDGPSIVTSVQPGSAAERAGVRAGDIIAAVNGQKDADIEDALRSVSPGETLKLRVQVPQTRRQREVELVVGSRKEQRYVIRDVESPTAAQLRRRAEWLAFSNMKAGSARP
jgi:predicted metalloprotease with PDZ domain